MDKMVLPGIEIRVESAHSAERLNLHFILDPKLSLQQLQDFINELKIPLKNNRTRSISNDAFIEWARELGADKLKKSWI